MKTVFWWRTTFGQEEIDRIAESITNENISQGPVTMEFEQKIADALEVPYALATTSGSTALLMALMALGIGPGDEVIVPNRTWIATAHAPLLLGAKVILVDVVSEAPLIDIQQIEQKITSRTKAIIPAHLNGRSTNMEAIRAISEKYGLSIVEDACQALFSKNDAGFLGTQSELGCFSLGVNKLISTAQGGIVVTKDRDLYEKLKLIRNHGTTNNITPTYILGGSNFKFTDISASMGLVQLQQAQSRLDHINQVYLKYAEALEDLPFLKILPVKVMQGEAPLYVEVLCPERAELINFLQSHNIEVRPFLPSLNKALYLENNDVFPNSEVFDEQGIFLPCGPAQPFENINRVIEVLKQFGKQREKEQNQGTA